MLNSLMPNNNRNLIKCTYENPDRSPQCVDTSVNIEHNVCSLYAHAVTSSLKVTVCSQIRIKLKQPTKFVNVLHKLSWFVACVWNQITN